MVPQSAHTRHTVILRGCVVLSAALLPYLWWLRAWRLRWRRRSTRHFLV